MSFRRWRPWRRAGGLLLAAVFAVSAGTAPLTMVSCPRHQAGLHVAGPGPHTMAGMSRTSDSPDDAPHSHDGPCGCLGTCAPGLGHASVAFAPIQALPAQFLSRIRSVSPDRTRPATHEPWLLPYPNGPPAAA